MSQVFYDPLVDLTPVQEVLEAHGLSEREQAAVLHELDGAVHHAVVECVLDILPTHEHEAFLESVAAAPHDESHLDTLSAHAADARDRVRAVIAGTHQRFLDAIHR